MAVENTPDYCDMAKIAESLMTFIPGLVPE
jgi:hypothetical protein